VSLLDHVRKVCGHSCPVPCMRQSVGMWRLATVFYVAFGLLLVPQCVFASGAASPAPANLKVRLDGPEFMAVGTPTTYRLFVGNTGGRARGVRAFLSLPAGVTFLDSTKKRCKSLGDTNTVMCKVGSLGPARFQYTSVTLVANGPGVGLLRASVISKSREFDRGDNADGRRVVLQPGPALADLSITTDVETAQPAGSPSPTYRFSVTVANEGPGAAVRVLVQYGLGAGIDIRVWSFPAFLPGVLGTNRGSTTCGDPALGEEQDPASAYPRTGRPEFCIPVIPAGTERTFDLWLAGPEGGTWGANADSATPDGDSSNNCISDRLPHVTNTVRPCAQVPPATVSHRETHS
jgi:hypothetical protein